MNPVAAGTDEETIQLQKKIMRERREAAMKRRLEEEEREEAAKKERLRLKLEAMGPPPERKSAKKDENKDDSPTKPYLPPAQREGGAPPTATKAPSSPEKPDIPATVVENEKEAIDDTISTAEAQINGGAQAPFNQARPQNQTTQTGLSWPVWCRWCGRALARPAKAASAEKRVVLVAILLLVTV